MRTIKKPRFVTVTSVFPASQGVIWDKLQQFATLQYIARPFASFTPAEGSKDFCWREGGLFRLHFKLFTILPFGIHTVEVFTCSEASHEIYTHESNPQVPVWNHRIVLKAFDETSTVYTDQVEVRAGWKTPLIRLWASLFYRHRQRRWRRLLSEGG